MVSLFEPLQLGAVELSNRIVMAPLTRLRASEDRTPNDLMRSYYCQRASSGLIITEASAVSPQGVGYPNSPGIWCGAQVEGWRTITDAVHKKGGKIFMQLLHAGRVSDPEVLHGQMPVAPSSIACPGKMMLSDLSQHPYVKPRALQVEEIKTIISDFTYAAANAREAGFDGIDIHAANGYLIDQFLHDHSNRRSDEYGGSVANRTRLLLEIVDGCIGVWGADRVGVHLSPYGGGHGMKDTNPELLFTHVARVLGERNIGYLFIRQSPGKEDLTAQIKHVFNGPIIINEGFDKQSANKALANNQADAVAFGRMFISNPDLVCRFQNNMPIAEWNEETFYSEGAKGYNDYPLHNLCSDN